MDRNLSTGLLRAHRRRPGSPSGSSEFCADIGTTWTLIGVVMLIGFGIMIAVANGGEKKTIEIDRT